jgi:molybdenum cofactor cytidylyltransferase
MAVPAIILAAGASRRLGQPKQLVQVGGETLLARTIRLAREAGSNPIFVVLGASGSAVAERVDLSQALTVTNPDWEQGIASSIRAGIGALLQSDPGATAAMLLVCDQPRLTSEHLTALFGAYEQAGGSQAGESRIVASRYSGIAGIPAIFPASQFASLVALQGDQGARHLLRESKSPVMMIDLEGGELDIDSPGDLAAITGEILALADCDDAGGLRS